MRILPMITIALLCGCAAQQATHELPYTPSPAWPSDWRPASGLDAPPSGVPHIDLTVDNVPDRWTATATIIDTTTFADQHQLGDPWSGPTARPGTLLPPHQRPKGLAEGPPNDLRPGGMRRGGGSPSTRLGGGGFEAIAQTPWTPPDPTLAVGPEHIVVTTNMAIAFYLKDGTETFSANLDSTGNPGFFEEIGGGTFTFDPKCFYDPIEDRFLVLALEVYEGSNEAWITIAVSDDSDPNGLWFKYRTWAIVNVDGSDYWVDYPGLGYDDEAFYVTGNLFRMGGGGFAGALYRVLPKAPLLSGDTATVFDIRRGGHASVQAAQHYGDAPGAYFVSNRDSTRIRISAISNPTTSPSISSSNVSVPAYSWPDGAPNLGGTLDTLDGRIMNALWRDGSLYTCHAVSGGAGSVARWYRFETQNWPVSGSLSLGESGEITTLEGHDTFYPAIAANVRGDAAVVLGAARSSEYPSIRVAGRRDSDSPGTMGGLTQVAIGDAGSDGRWGDYFDMTVDPNDDTRFWFVGEYARDYGWQTWVGSMTVTCVEDINGDGAVSIEDLLAVIAAWGTDGNGAEIAAPYNITDISDLLGVVAAFGNCP